MGANNSTSEKNLSKAENNVYTINKSTINELNENIQSNTQSATTEIVNANTTQATAQNSTNISGLTLKAKNFKIGQNNEMAVIFTVQNINNIVTQLQTDITNTISNYLKENLTNDIESDLVNNAIEKINNGFLNTKDALKFGDVSNSENIQETINNIQTENDIEKNIENIVKLCVETTINTNLVNQCINTNGNYNEVNINNSNFNLDEGFIIDQSNIVDIAVNCLNNNQLINTITDKLLQITDITVINDTENKETAKTEKITQKEETNEGIGDAAGKVIDKAGDVAGEILDKSGDVITKTTEGAGTILSKTGDALSNIFKSSTGIFIVIGIVAILVVIAVVYALTNENTGKNVGAVSDLVMKVNPATAGISSAAAVLNK